MKRLFITLCMSAGLLPALVWAAPVVSGPNPNAPSAGPTAPESALSNRLRLGHEALARRDYPQARALFREAAAQVPASPLPHLGLAELARVTGDEAATRQALGNALKVAPRDAKTLFAWGSWHSAKGEFDKAAEFWNASLSVDPAQPQTLVELGGLALEVRKRPAEAAALFKRALAINPQLGGARYALGMTLWQLSKPDEAIAEFEEAARLSPKNPLPLHSLGRVHAQAGRAELAMVAFEKAIVAEPAYYPARLSKADLLGAAGKFDLALVETRGVLASQPKLPEAHQKAGMLLQSLGRVPEAMAAYQEALKFDPNLAFALNNLASLAVQRKDVPDHGLAWAQNAVALQPQNPLFQGTLAWVLHKSGETAKALAVIEPVVKGQGRKTPESHYVLGAIYADSGDKQRASAALREALRLNPGFSGAADATQRLRKLQSPS